MQAKTIEVIDLPKILDKRGNLSIVEEFKHISHVLTQDS